MPEGYGTQRDYVEAVEGEADERQDEIESALRSAFSTYIETREVEVVVFNSMSAHELASAMLNHPVILKPLLSYCNLGQRAIERDLGIKNVDTYSPNLDEESARVIAGYIKPFLPPYAELPSLSRIDRVYFIDKEIRKMKGNWEKRILKAINKHAQAEFKKRMFSTEGDTYELDAASPRDGDIEYGIDVKRIEARRDIHKRADEIVNKASKFKQAFPSGKFGAVVYYPFIDEQVNIEQRLRSSNIDGVVFASESGDSIESAARMLLSMLDVEQKA